MSKIGIEETIRVFNDIWGTNMDKIRDSYQYVGKIDNNSRPNDVQNMAKRLHQGLVHYCEVRINKTTNHYYITIRD